MKKLVVLFIMICTVSLYSLNVDTEEISGNYPSIEFENYSGPYQKRETVFQIMAIGSRLANEIEKEDVDSFRYHMKYSIYRGDGEEGDTAMKADVFSIDEDALVDHVRNIRLIIASYLRRMYGYNLRDSNNLAFFITIYNAVHRQDLEFFGSKYNAEVMSYLDADNAGLSTKYEDWAGKTRIVIPLTDNAERGRLSSLDTSELTEDNVIRELQNDPDKGIDEREKIVELKEKEVEQEKDILQKEKEQVETEKKVVEEKKQEVEKQKEQITVKEKEIEQEKEEAEKITDPVEKEEKEKEIAEKEEELIEQKKEVEEKEKEVEEKQEELAEKEEEIEKTEEKIAEKEQEVTKEKETIEKDKEVKEISKNTEKKAEELFEKEKELVEKEKELEKIEENLKKEETDENIVGAKLYYLKINEYMTGGHYSNEMFIINAATRKIEKKSPYNSIGGRKYDIFSDGVVVIGKDSEDNQKYYLVLLDKETLEAKSVGTDNIFWRSFIEVRDNFIYAIVKDGENYYLGKFDSTMSMTSKSEVTVESNSFVSFFNDVVYINSAEGGIAVLSREDLTQVEVIAP